MGYLVISDHMLSQEQLFNVLRDADNTSLDEGEIPFEVLLANGNEFYVQLLAKEPYEYLVLSMDELGHVMKEASQYPDDQPEHVLESARQQPTEQPAQQPTAQPPQQPQRKEAKQSAKKQGKKSKPKA